MILDGQFCNLINKRANSQKKISKYDARHLSIILGFIRHINSLPEDVYLVFERNIDDLLIPVEFKDLIIPRSVRLIPGDRKYTDLLQRDSWALVSTDVENSQSFKPEAITYTDLINAYDSFRSQFKKDAHSDMVTIGSVRNDVSLIEVLDRLAFESKCVDCNDRVPLELDDISALHENRLLSYDVSDAIEDFVWSLNF